MTLSELIEQLQEMQDDLNIYCDGADPTIMLATQPSWPLEEGVSMVEMNDPLADFYEEYGQTPEQAENYDPNDEDFVRHWETERDNACSADRRIYFAGGFSNNYLQSGMAAKLGWS